MSPTSSECALESQYPPCTAGVTAELAKPIPKVGSTPKEEKPPSGGLDSYSDDPQMLTRSIEAGRLAGFHVPPRFRSFMIKSIRGELSPTQAIKAGCLDCSNYQPNEIRLCPCNECPVYRHRPYQNGGRN